MKKLFGWIHENERRLSGAAMVLGFIFDNIFFNRIDEAITHQVFISYLGIAALTIGMLHYLEEHTADGARRPKWRSLLPITTQFAIGGLLSGFLIFYTRSATLATSWPFLLLLGGIFLGNEIFKKYHDRLVFNAVLYFFAVYSYAIFAVPLLTHDIGTGTFILSGVCAVGVFAVFMILLRRLGRFRFSGSAWHIRLYAGSVFLAMNLFYFANILPPLPLALMHGGIYESLERSATGYTAQAEPTSWQSSFGLPATVHLAPGSSLYAYSAVFAPIALNTRIVHEWQWYDEARGQWVVRGTTSFSISGGRAGGYRGYSLQEISSAGAWRVNIKTGDGRLVGRLRFAAELGARGVRETVEL